MQGHVDPVCGMPVNPGTPFKTIYKGKLYYFCSKHCLEAFEKDPEFYLTHGPQGMPHDRRKNP